MQERDYLRIFEANKRQFEEKWGKSWEPHRYREPAGRSD